VLNVPTAQEKGQSFCPISASPDNDAIFSLVHRLFKLRNMNFNPLQPKVFGVKFSLRETERIFFTKIRKFKLFKMPKL